MSRPSYPGRLEVIRKPFTPRDELARGLTGTLVLRGRAESHIHIWSGRARVEIDLSGVDLSAPPEELENAIVRRARELAGRAVTEPAELVRYGEKLVIPGSSLKGAIRSRLELLARPKDNRVAACFAIQGRLTRPPAPGQHGWRHYKIWEPSVKTGRPQACRSCLICDIFGSPGSCSRVSFGNLELQGEPGEWVEELRLDHGERMLAFKPGAAFRGELTFTCLEPEELGLLLIGMRLHDGKPILIGKSKYRLRVREDTQEKVRLGRLKLEAEELRLAFWCEELASRLASEANASFTKGEEGDLIFEGEGLDKLVKLLIEKAREKYADQGFDFDFDEVAVLEEIWRGEG